MKMSLVFVIFGAVCGGVIGRILGWVIDCLIEEAKLRQEDLRLDGAFWGACMGAAASWVGLVNFGIGGSLIGAVAAAPALAIAMGALRLFSWCWWECFRAFVTAVDAVAARSSIKEEAE